MSLSVFAVFPVRGAELPGGRGEPVLHGRVPGRALPAVRHAGHQVLRALARRAQGPPQPHVHSLPHSHQVRKELHIDKYTSDIRKIWSSLMKYRVCSSCKSEKCKRRMTI